MSVSQRMGLGIGAMLVGVFIFRVLLPDRPEVPISSVGGQQMDVLPWTPCHYLQGDARWSKDTVGGSEEPLSMVGCTVSCVAMAATMLGHPVTPGELNTSLKKQNGYTSKGWLVWDRLETATGGRITGRPADLSHERLDTALQEGQIPVVKILLRGQIPHWVVLCGKQGGEYLALDPLSRKYPLPLSGLSPTIHAVRMIRSVHGSTEDIKQTETHRIPGPAGPVKS